MKTMQRWKAIVLSSLLCGLEAAGIAALIWAAPGQQIPGFALSHGAAALLAGGLRGLLPLPYRAGALGALLPGVLVLLLPGFGLLGLMLVVIPALHYPVYRQERTWRRIQMPRRPPALPAHLVGHVAGHVADPDSGPATWPAPGHAAVPGADPGSGSLVLAGEKSLIDIIQSNAPVEHRIAAVMALRQLPTRTAVPILRVALRDPSDDVRLLAYAMLDRRDAALHGRIQHHEAELERDDLSPAERATAHRALARLHWELSYCGLATGAVATRALDSARDHARAVLDAEDDRGILFLLGRILLRQGELRAAEHVLLEAREQGIDDSSVRPFLAEIAFLERRFQHVRTHLQAGGRNGEQRPGIVSHVGRFWLVEAA